MSILHTLPLRERPAYKLTKGPGGYCNLTELLAALIGGPDQLEIAYALIAKFSALPSIFNALDTELQEVPGIGPVRAARLKAALELGMRWGADLGEEKFTIRSPGDSAQILMPELAHLEREHFVVLILDTRNRLMSKFTLYTGNGNSLNVRVAEVFTEAVRRRAASIIVAHNHPSGDPTPSPEDVNITSELVKAGHLLNIEVLDHIIIGNQRFVSLRERALGFS